MNAGDVFLLHAGLVVYQWNGESANKDEKRKVRAPCLVRLGRAARAPPLLLPAERASFASCSIVRRGGRSGGVQPAGRWVERASDRDRRRGGQAARSPARRRRREERGRSTLCHRVATSIPALRTRVRAARGTSKASHHPNRVAVGALK
jgi:hypothetical protein